MSDEKLKAAKDEALFMNRLINAYNSAQTVVEQLRPALQQFGLLKANGSLDVDRVLLVNKKARGEQ